jgi:hypothetical protein
MKHIFTLLLLTVLFSINLLAQNRRDGFYDDVYGSNDQRNRPSDRQNHQDNNYPYSDPNYYPNPYGNNGNRTRDFDNYRYDQGQNWNQGGRCAQQVQPIYVHRPMRPRPVIIVPPSYCAPVLINPYPRHSYKPRHFRHYGYGYRRF